MLEHDIQMELKLITMETNNYIEINKKTWNEKTEVHVNSDFYDNENFMNGKSSLNTIELELLGDISGKKTLHLQCHFGQDTLSMARMGAIATGVDLSNKAIQTATELNNQLQLNAQFVCSDIYDLPNHLTGEFDIVFTSYGTIGWLPDLDKWAKVITHFLKPNGKFIIADFHPVVWMYDNDFKEVFYSYFNIEPIMKKKPGHMEIETLPLKRKQLHGIILRVKF